MDNDIDSMLLQQFSSMATQDRDVLIAQFKSFLGNDPLNDSGCEFYLDMNNWLGNFCQHVTHYPGMRVVRFTTSTLPLGNPLFPDGFFIPGNSGISRVIPGNPGLPGMDQCSVALLVNGLEHLIFF